MSRIGLKIIDIPEGVDVSQSGQTVTVKGKLGELQRDIDPNITMTIEDNQISFERPNDNKRNKAMHGTTRALIANMIHGVSEGFEKRLTLVGVGYRAMQQGNGLDLNVGLSHPVHFEATEGVEIDVPENTSIIVKGYDKEKVGQLAANIRAIRPPEPYKGKGIRYENEQIVRKEGKTGK